MENLVSNNPKIPFYQSDLDLHPMTLIFELDLDMVNMSYHTKTEVSMSNKKKSYSPNRHIDSTET